MEAQLVHAPYVPVISSENDVSLYQQNIKDFELVKSVDTMDDPFTHLEKYLQPKFN